LWRSFFFGQEGVFAAYVVFDRPISGRAAAPHKGTKAHPDAAGGVARYTIMISSGSDVRDAAEEKLQLLLTCFASPM
jgi:hypothetical protein